MQHPEALKQSMHLAARKMNIKCCDKQIKFVNNKYVRERNSYIYTIILGNNLVQIGFWIINTIISITNLPKNKGDETTNFYLPESDNLCDIVI